MADKYCSTCFKTGEELDAALQKALQCDNNANRAEQAARTAEAAAEEAKKAAENGGNAGGLAITSLVVAESANGSVTITESLEDGTTNTIAITADANGNPSSVGGIPIEWVVSA